MLRTHRQSSNVATNIFRKDTICASMQACMCSYRLASALSCLASTHMRRLQRQWQPHQQELVKNTNCTCTSTRHDGFAVRRSKPDISLGQFNINEAYSQLEGTVSKVKEFSIESIRKTSWRLDEHLRRTEHYIRKQGFFYLPTFYFPWYRGCLPLYSSYQIRILYHRHHRAHVNKLNELIEGTPLYGMQLDEIIHRTHNNEAYRGVYNHAAQHFNFCFFWKNIEPYGSNIPPDLCAAITAQYGSVEAFQERFINSALNLFGSGWVYFIYDKSSNLFDILSLSNAGCPLVNRDFVPLLCINVWEQAYYIDYENNRAEYLSKFFDVVDWHWAERYWKRATNQTYHIIDCF